MIAGLIAVIIAQVIVELLTIWMFLRVFMERVESQVHNFPSHPKKIMPGVESQANRISIDPLNVNGITFPDLSDAKMVTSGDKIDVYPPPPANDEEVMYAAPILPNSAAAQEDFRNLAG
jgi:hypothetical protein